MREKIKRAEITESLVEASLCADGGTTGELEEGISKLHELCVEIRWTEKGVQKPSLNPKEI